MTITFQCEKCQQEYTIGDHTAGQLIQCKQCGSPITVPGQHVHQSTSQLLSPQVMAGLRSQRIYEGQGSILQVLSDITAMRDLDAESEELERKGRKIAVFSGVGVALGVIMIVAGMAFVTSPAIFIPGVLIGIGGIIGLIFGIQKKKTHGRLNLENRRYEVPAKLLGLLRADAKPGEPMSCHIDFDDHNAKRKLVREGKAGHWNVKYFISRWLDINGRLADSTKYSLAMLVKHQDRHRTKRSASGKLKHKSKSKTSQEYIVKLKVKATKYPQLKELLSDVSAKASAAVRLPQEATVKSLEVSEDGLSLAVTIPRGFTATDSNETKVIQKTVEVVTSMLLSLYQILNLCKAIDKA